MIIKEIELKNFRIYKDSCRISLDTVAGKNIYIVSGRNGFGKTTFLMSLVWCLYGRQMSDVDDLYKKEISDQGSYAKYIINSLNRLAKAEGDYNFHVSITFTNVNIPEVPCKEIVVKRSYNAKTSLNEEVDILIDGYPSEIAKEVGPEIFIREFIMPLEIAKFFFFDAEKIVSLAEVTTTDQKRNLSKAYSEVLGIKKYEDIKAEFEGLQLKLRQDSASTKEKAEFRSLETERQNCEDELLDLNEGIKGEKDGRDDKSKDSRDIQEKLIKSGSLITVEELMLLRQKEENLIKELEEIQSALKNQYDLIPLAIAGANLLDINSQIENEANYKAAQFKEENVKGITNKVLTDLLNAPKPEKLAIDHQVHSFYADTFEKLIRKHFFSDTPHLPEGFEMIHEFSDSERNELATLMNNIKFSFRDTFKRINSEYNQTRNELGSIRKQIRAAEGNEEDPIIASLRKQKDEIDKEVIRINGTIESLNRSVGEVNSKKIQLTNRVSDLSKKLEVSEKNKEKDETLSRNITTLKKFIIEFKAKKKESLERQILDGLNTLLHKKGFVENVEVELIGEDIDIILRNSRGEEIKKESLSKGEQQMYATALLRGLVEESDIQFPVFIDSPMQKFDEQHAENIVKYFYPNISDQVILFPLINKELTEKEFNILAPNIAKTYLINNIHQDKSEFIPLAVDQFLKTYNEMYNVN